MNHKSDICTVPREVGWVMVKQAVDARESSWRWVHLSIPVVDGELGKLVLAKARGYHETQYREGLCVSKAVPGDSINNQHSVFTN